MTKKAPRTIIYPSLSDPRLTGLLFVGCYVAFAIISPGFGRSIEQFVTGLATAVVLDFAFQYFYWSLLLVPISAVFPGCTVTLLCDSPDLWPFAVVVGAAILSKHLIRTGGRHIFNPINFGIVFGLLFFGDHLRVTYVRWGGHWPIVALIVALGFITSYRCRRIALPVSYITAFVAGAFIQSLIQGCRFMTVAAPATGPIFHVFAFVMIPDPGTSPRWTRGQIVFGVAIAVLETVMRIFEIRDAPFYSLFIITGLMPIFLPDDGIPLTAGVWKPRARVIGGRPRRRSSKNSRTR
ncbi:MAG: hypothetical protein ABII00_00185 [Elusimicrobiota bacterium]